MTHIKDAEPTTIAEQADALKETWDRVRLKTDGCTNAPDFDFMQCCIAHDLRYRENPEHKTRAETDALFRKCIADRGRPILAWFYWMMVRVGGRKGWKYHDEIIQTTKPDDKRNG